MLIWNAVGNDGSYLPQYNEDGKENKYTDIDRDTLERFVLTDAQTGKAKLVLNLDSEKKLIFRRRTAKSVDNEIKEVVYILGWQQNIAGHNVQAIAFYFESTGHIEMTDGFTKDHRWFYPVTFLPEEEI